MVAYSKNKKFPYSSFRQVSYFPDLTDSCNPTPT